MEQLLPQLLSFPPHPPPADPLSDAEYDKQIEALVRTLSKTPMNKLVSGVKAGGDLLDIIDPSINTLPYLYVLLAHIGTSSGKAFNKGSDKALPPVSKSFAPREPLWEKMTRFMDQFDPVQIRYAGHEMRRLIDFTAHQAEQLEQPSAAIVPITQAILRIDPSSATFTSSHLTLSLLALSARAFEAVLPVLEKDITFVPSTSPKQDDPPVNGLLPFLCSKHVSSSNYITLSSGLTARIHYDHYLLYHLYSAMIYIAVKRWPRALYLLEIVIGAPTARDNSAATSKIQVEAFKKWVLVGILHKGQMVRMPKNISFQTSRTYQILCKAYTALAETFKDGIKNEENDNRLVAEAQYARPVWQEDYNEGLVNQVIRAYRRFSVQHLERVYRALTVADVARRTSLDPTDYAETADYLMELISKGLLDAKIFVGSSDDPASWVLRFNSHTSKDNTAQSEEQQHDALRKQTEKIETLTREIKEADRQLALGKEYIQDARKARSAKDNPWSDEQAAQSMLNQEFFAHEEDMMEDV